MVMPEPQSRSLYEQLGITGEERLPAAGDDARPEIPVAHPDCRWESPSPPPADAPDHLVLDFESEREDKWITWAILWFLIAGALFFLSTDDRRHRRKAYCPSLFPVGLACLGVSACYAGLRFVTRDIHVLDVRTGIIHRQESFLFRKNTIRRFERGRLKAVLVRPHLKSHKGRTWFEYEILAVQRSGEAPSLAQARKDKELVLGEARLVAGAMEAPLGIEPEPEA